MADRILRRNTRQRQVILEELRKLDTHPTASDLFEVTRHRLPRISLGTVYRNLELLVEMGLATRLGAPASEARFDGTVGPHCHVRCVRCGSVADAEGLSQEAVLGEVDELSGYAVIGCHLEYQGICPECRRLRPSGVQTEMPGEAS